MLYSGAMDHLTEEQRESLIYDIAGRLYTTTQLMSDYQATKEQLEQFVRNNTTVIERERALSFPELLDTEDPLWIAHKNERLQRYQTVADRLYDSITNDGFGDAVLLREFRAYLLAAANELGQLLHRGSGDAGTGDTLNVEFTGTNMDTLQ